MADIRINALATTATTPASDDYLALDGTAQGTRKILATNIANNVTDVILGTSGPSVKSTLSARAPRQGLVFDGTAGATATISALGTAPFTVSAVFSAKSLAANNAIIDFNTGVGSSILIYVTTTGRIVIYDRVANATLYQSNTGVIEVNKIYHIAYARGVGVFVNGVNISGSFADGSNYTDTVYRIGWAASNDSFCTGFLSVLIYNRALSASEVVALYEAGAPAGADYPARSAGTTLNTVAWANNGAIPYTTFSSSGPTTFTAVQASGTGFANSGATDFWSVKKGDKVLVTGSVALNNGKTILPYVTLYNSGTGAERATGVQLTSSGSFSVTLTANAADSVMVVFSTIGDADYTVSSISVKSLGLLLAPDAAQAGGGLVWYDTSGNAANITLPASGVSWNVPSSAKVATGWAFGGDVGIGTTSPEGRLHLAASASGATGSILVLDNPIASALNNSNQIAFLNDVGASYAGIANVRLKSLTTNAGNGSSAFTITTFDGSSEAERVRVFANGNFGIGTGSTDGGQKLQVNGTAAFSGTVTTTNSFTTSTRTPGNDTAIQTLRADAANTDWPFQLSSIYDGGYVDNFAIFGGILGTGTRSAPKFTSANATGAWILRSFEGGAYFYVSRVAGASTNASPTDILSFNSTGNATFAGTVIANKATTAFRIPTAETPASASATGTIGTITWDTSYIYVCTAANTWKRVAIATW